MNAKALLFFLIILVFTTSVLSQTTNDPDTVCIGEISYYKVYGDSGSTFNWVVTGGTLTFGQGTDSIEVQWNNPGTAFSVSVQETNQYNCTGPTLSLGVSVFDVPTAVIAGSDTLCNGVGVTNQIEISLTGNSPWTVSYSDGVNSYTETINVSPYTISGIPLAAGVYTYGITALTDAVGCTNTGTGSASLTVSPPVNTTGIFHN